jgi:hypothetical protein
VTEWPGSLTGVCAQCVAQGAVYVGGALAGLQVMAARARTRRRAATSAVAPSADSGEEHEDAKVDVS